MLPGHPSLRLVILLGRIKPSEPLGDLLTEYGASQASDAFDLLNSSNFPLLGNTTYLMFLERQL